MLAHETLAQYHEEAVKILKDLMKKHGSYYRTICEILASPTLLGDLVHKLASCENKFDPEKGNLHGYKTQNAIWFIKDLRSDQKKASQKDRILSLNYGVGEDQELSDLIPSNIRQPDEIVIREEEMERQKNFAHHIIKPYRFLTQNQSDNIRQHFLESRTIVSIAEEKNVSPQAVHYSINAGLKKLKRACQDIDYDEI